VKQELDGPFAAGNYGDFAVYSNRQTSLCKETLNLDHGPADLDGKMLRYGHGFRLQFRWPPWRPDESWRALEKGNRIAEATLSWDQFVFSLPHEASMSNDNPPKLLDQVRNAMRLRHYSLRTEES
jgi:hypothetical protein